MAETPFELTKKRSFIFLAQTPLAPTATTNVTFGVLLRDLLLFPKHQRHVNVPAKDYPQKFYSVNNCSEHQTLGQLIPMNEKRLFENKPREVVPQEISACIEDEFNENLANAWSSKELQDLDIEQYADRIKQNGSGHIAIHAAPMKIIDLVLERGWLASTNLGDGLAQQNNLKTRFIGRSQFVNSNAMHFTLDRPYTSYAGQADRRFLFVSSVEALLENKAFQNIPLESINSDEATANDMAVGGMPDNPLNEKHKFKIDELGILLVPKNARVFKSSGEFVGENWNEEETPTVAVQEFVSTARKKGIPMPKRIFFFDGHTAEDALNSFVTQFGLKIPPQDKKIKISGPIVPLEQTKEAELKRDGGHSYPDGKGPYFAINHASNQQA